MRSGYQAVLSLRAPIGARQSSPCHCGAGVRWTPLRSRNTDRAGRRDRRKACGNPFFPFRVLRILSCSALRMTNRFVIASTNRCAAIRSFPLRHCDRRKACGNPFFPFRVLRILSCSALRMTNRFVIANAVRQAAIFLLLFLTRNFLFNH